MILEISDLEHSIILQAFELYRMHFSLSVPVENLFHKFNDPIIAFTKNCDPCGNCAKCDWCDEEEDDL